MRLPLMTVMLMTALSAALAAGGLWLFVVSLAPVPGKLETFRGVAAEVTYSKSRSRLHLKQADGTTLVFGHPPRFERFRDFVGKISVGKAVEVTAGPGGKSDIWGLKLESQVVMTSAQARDARVAFGRRGLGMFAVCLIITAWLASMVPRLRRKGA